MMVLKPLHIAFPICSCAIQTSVKNMRLRSVLNRSESLLLQLFFYDSFLGLRYCGLRFIYMMQFELEANSIFGKESAAIKIGDYMLNWEKEGTVPAYSGTIKSRRNQV